jgi:hypothetical protein
MFGAFGADGKLSNVRMAGALSRKLLCPALSFAATVVDEISCMTMLFADEPAVKVAIEGAA